MAQISNAADACDKKRFLSLTNGDNADNFELIQQGSFLSDGLLFKQINSIIES